MLPLETFLAGYLSQDVDVVFGTPDDAVIAFTRRPQDEVHEARSGLVDLLARHPADDDALVAEALALGCEYNPPVDGELRRLFAFAVERWSSVAQIATRSPD